MNLLEFVFIKVEFFSQFSVLGCQFVHFSSSIRLFRLQLRDVLRYAVKECSARQLTTVELRKLVLGSEVRHGFLTRFPGFELPEQP